MPKVYDPQNPPDPDSASNPIDVHADEYNKMRSRIIRRQKIRTFISYAAAIIIFGGLLISALIFVS